MNQQRFAGWLCAALLAAWPTLSTAATLPNDLALYVIENIESESPLTSRLAEVNLTTGSISQTFSRQSYIRLSSLAYDASTDSLFGFSRQSSTLLTIDRATGNYTPVGGVERGVTGGVRDLAIHPATNELYGITLLGELVRINKFTAERTHVGSSSKFRFAHGLAFSRDGRLFASDTLGVGSGLFEIDVQTGEATRIATIDRDFVVALDFHPDGRLFGLDNGSHGLIAIDITSGLATSIGSFRDGVDRQAMAFYFVPEPASLLSLGIAALACAAAPPRRRF